MTFKIPNYDLNVVILHNLFFLFRRFKTLISLKKQQKRAKKALKKTYTRIKY